MKVRLSLISFFLLCLSAPSFFPSIGYSQNPDVLIEVDAAVGRRPISPDIYGVNLADAETLADLNIPLNRFGGNSASRYNWRINAANRAADHYFESIAYADSEPARETDAFIAATKSVGAQPLMTIPMVGWVAKLGPARSLLSSFSVAKYGPQAKADPLYPDAGNGIFPDGRVLDGNDPTDANVWATVEFQREWVEHMKNKFGPADGGGLRYYVLDNEYGLWHSTHRDAHPDGTTMAEGRDKMLAHAAMIKAVDPTAVVMGPEEWGWLGYRLSGFDLKFMNDNKIVDFAQLPDRKANGGVDHLPWLLGELRKREQQTGKRLIDIVSVHYHPQGGEPGDDVTPQMQALRNRSTRSLWDPNYKDESYIQDRVRLIPRLREWVNGLYPGAKIALTEYNWGAGNHINGATAQADVLGIFGREGIDMAVRSAVPEKGTLVYNVFKMFRNYDGNKSTFGDLSVSTKLPDSDDIAAYSAVRASDGALTIMIVGKFPLGSRTVQVALSNVRLPNKVEIRQLTAANQIVRMNDLTVSRESVRFAVPAQSITLLVVPGEGNNPPAVDSIPDQTVTATQTATVSVKATDPDGASGLKLSLSTALPFVSLTDAGNGIGTIRIAPTASEKQGGQVTVTATDAGGLTAQASFNVTVQPVEEAPRPPMLDPIADQTLKAGQTLEVNVKASDLDGPAGLRLSLTIGPAYVTLTDLGGGVGKIRLAPAAADVGLGRVFVTVSDPQGLTAMTAFSIRVLPDVTVTGARYAKPILEVSGRGFAGNDFKVFVNGVDVTEFVQGRDDSKVMLKGNYKKLNLKKKDVNLISVAVGGFPSNVFQLGL